MKTSEKINALIQWGTKPYRIAKATEVPENTVRDIWNGKTPIDKIKLGNAEKIAAHYDLVESSLSKAIATLDVLIERLDSDRQRLTGNYNLYQKIKREPYKVFEHLHKIAMDVMYSDKINQHNDLLQEIERYMSAVDVDIAYSITLSDKYEYYMSVQRNTLEVTR